MQFLDHAERICRFTGLKAAVRTMRGTSNMAPDPPVPAVQNALT